MPEKSNPIIPIIAAYKLLMKRGEELLGLYEQGSQEVTFQDLVDYSRNMERARGELQDLMEVEINQFNGKCKNAKQKRTSSEREAERKKSISELGF